MKFILHINPETGKRTLHSFMSHVPAGTNKDELVEIDIPTDKDGMREAFQEALDMPTELESSQEPQNAPEAVPPTDTAEMLVLPKEGPLSAKQELDLRTMVLDQWDNLPFAWKTDLMCGLMDQVRNLKPRIEA